MGLCRRHLSQNLPVLSFRTTFPGNIVRKQLKNPFFVTMKPETFVLQISYPFGCYNTRHVHLLWSPAPLFQVWLQKMCPCRQGNKLSAKHLRRPCIQSQTDVEAQRHQFSTVHNQENLVLWTPLTLCTSFDSENESKCVVPHRFDRECLDL